MKLPNAVALENVMKIGQSPDSRPAVGTAGLSKSGQGASTSAVSAKATVSSGVPVTVSGLAQEVRVSSGGDIDTAKVEQVRAAIANGTYKVNPEAIADKLLSNAKEMLNRPQH
jgi:negative regulator of flagellin synthesis FlgM